MLVRDFCSGISGLLAVPETTSNRAVRLARGSSNGGGGSSAMVSMRSHLPLPLESLSSTRISTRKSAGNRQASFDRSLANLFFEELSEEIALEDGGVRSIRPNDDAHDVIGKQRLAAGALDLFLDLIQHGDANFGDFR